MCSGTRDTLQVALHVYVLGPMSRPALNVVSFGTWDTVQTALDVCLLGPNALPSPWPALPRPALPLVASSPLSLLKLTAVSIGFLFLCLVSMLTGLYKCKNHGHTCKECLGTKSQH